jgi:hypothetical protein
MIRRETEWTSRPDARAPPRTRILLGSHLARTRLVLGNNSHGGLGRGALGERGAALGAEELARGLGEVQAAVDPALEHLGDDAARRIEDHLR